MNKNQIEHHLKTSLGLGELFDFRLEKIERNRAIMRLVYGDVHLRPGGTISGPSLMTLVDATVYALILHETQGAIMAVTQNLNIHFLEKPPARDIWAIARLLRITQRSVVAHVDIYDQNPDDLCENTDTTQAPHKLLASASTTYALPKRH